MPSEKDLHDYQKKAIGFAVENPKCAMFLDMGCGKTVITLTTIQKLLRDLFVTRVLIIAPIAVAKWVWPQEVIKWDHVNSLSVSLCIGTEKKRCAGLSSDADIHIINRENVPWLIETQPWKWDMVVIDESSSFKNPACRRFEALRTILPRVSSMILLTGTPAPQGYADLWSQVFLIDEGYRLGYSYAKYIGRYFRKKPNGYGIELQSGAGLKIMRRLVDIAITMSAIDYLKVPKSVPITKNVELPEQAMGQYLSLKNGVLVNQKKRYFLDFGGGQSVKASNERVLLNKLLQISNGAVYDSRGGVCVVHDEKLKALNQIIEENPGCNILVAYSYKSDLDRIRNYIPMASVLGESDDCVDRWNNGHIRVLLAHPASASYGLNIQYGGSVIVWYSLTWSLEFYQQFNARLVRQGQCNTVRIIHLVASGTIDDVVMRVIGRKADGQAALLSYLKK
jgi:SNF2 family DNA or RNA helicase